MANLCRLATTNLALQPLLHQYTRFLLSVPSRLPNGFIIVILSFTPVISLILLLLSVDAPRRRRGARESLVQYNKAELFVSDKMGHAGYCLQKQSKTGFGVIEGVEFNGAL